MRYLMIGEKERRAIAELRQRAAMNPREVRDILAAAKGGRGCPEARALLNRIAEYRVTVPDGYLCTFAVETGHSQGTARHMSILLEGGARAAGLLPCPDAVVLLMAEFGFEGGPAACQINVEALPDGRRALHIAQIITPIVSPLTGEIARA